MKPIVTLTLNPTIDGSSTAEKIRPLHKIRTTDERYHPGGGGINVARVVRELGGNALALYLAGGAPGNLLEDLLRHERIDAQRIPIKGYTRIAHTVFERSSEQEYRFVPDGPEISAKEWNACLAALEMHDFDYVVASGSLPRGLPADAYHRVIDIAAGKHARVILDTSGAALRATLDKGVFLVKPSLGELEELFGQPFRDPGAAEAAARELVEAGHAEIIAVTLGRDGAILVGKNGTWRLVPPPIEARSAVGAGDSFVAAMTVAIVQGRSLDAALAYAVAAGTAAVLSPGAELARSEDVERLYAALRADAPEGEAAATPTITPE
ncbi:1-phosphofructokinase family hexose kinase [Sphingopyxis chilensis]